MALLGDGLQMGCRPSKSGNDTRSKYMPSKTDSDYIRQAKLPGAGLDGRGLVTKPMISQEVPQDCARSASVPKSMARE